MKKTENTVQATSHSLRDKLKKNISQKEKPIDSIFTGKKFTFIPYGMVLSMKRISILSENVKKKGGRVIPHTDFPWDSPIFNSTLVIATKEMPYEYLRTTFPTISEKELTCHTFIDCEWITICLQKHQCVEPEPYYIKWPEMVPEDKLHHAPMIVKQNLNDNIAIKEVWETKDGISHSENPETKHDKKEVIIEDSVKKWPEKKENNDNDDDIIQIQNEVVGKLHPKQKGDRKDYLSRYAYLYDYLYEPEQEVFSTTDDSNSNSLFSLIKKESMLIENEVSSKMEEETVMILDKEKIEHEIKADPHVKQELNIKREAKVKTEGATPNFAYVIDDDDDELIYEGKSRKKVKLEPDDVKGTFLEGVKDLDKINVGDNEEIVELKEFKAFNPSKKLKKKESKDSKEIMLCQPATKTNLNSHITNVLEKLLKICELHNDKGSTLGYGKIIASLKAFPKKIETIDDLSSLSGIGPITVLKIKEILETGRLKKLEVMQSDQKTQILELFNEVYGIGPVTALTLYNKGFRTIQELRNNIQLLNETQKIGLKYYEDFNQKIPRQTVTEVVNIVIDSVDKLSEYKGQFDVICGGSYRRGRTMCGDIDIMMSPKDGKPVTGFLTKLIKKLEKGLLTDHLALPFPETNGSETYLGVCLYKGVHRRINFKICPRDRFGPLMIYYTGSDYFNRSLRIVAANKGYHLENYGIYPAVKTQSTKYALQNIPCYTEQDVFRILGLKYIPPEERDV